MKYAVDKIIDDIVVLEEITTGEIIEKKLMELPDNISEGNIVVFSNNKYVLDKDKELLRKESLRERLERLKNLKK